MEIIEIQDYVERRFNTAIALGNFDGIHIAHQELISTMVKNAKKCGLKPSILLFNHHTKAILEGKSPKLLTSEEKKSQILEDLGVEIIYKINFNKDLRKLSPKEFVENILIHKLNVKSVTVGFDYRFGYKALGTPEDLKKIGEKYGFKVIIIDPIYKDDIVSSTKIRSFLSEGNIEDANKMLGRNYSIMGKVITGKQRGTDLGFPTANLKINDNYLIPKIGIYKTNIITDGIVYLGATSIGKNPTFDDDDLLKIETHIIDFNGNIYGKTIELEFIKYLRDEIKFKSLADLKEQIKKDVNIIKSGH